MQRKRCPSRDVKLVNNVISKQFVYHSPPFGVFAFKYLCSKDAQLHTSKTDRKTNERYAMTVSPHISYLCIIVN